MHARTDRTENTEITLKVREAQIQQLYKQSWIGLAGIVVNIFLISIILWGVIPHWRLLLWSGVMVLVTVARSILVVSFNRKSPSGSGIYLWARLHVAGTSASGVMWALPSFFLWPTDSPLHQDGMADLYCFRERSLSSTL